MVFQYKIRSLADSWPQYGTRIFNLGWIILFFVLQQIPLTAGIFGNPDNIIRNWNFADWSNALFGVPGIVPFLYPLWFLRDLFILNFFASLIWKLMDRLPNITLAVALVMWFKYAMSNTSVPDFQSICFWVFGAYIVKKNIRLEVLDKIPFLLILIVFFSAAWKDRFTVYTPENLPWHNLAMALGIVFVFKLCSYIKKGRVQELLLKLSAYSFSIYLFHEFTTLAFRKFAASIFPVTVASQFIQYLMIPIAVTVFCLLLSIVLKRITPRLYAFVTGGR